MSDTGEVNIIYSNLLELCKWRGARVIHQVAPKAVGPEIESNGYARIDAERSGDAARGDARIAIFLFSPMRGIDASAARFGTFLERILKEKGSDAREFNIVFVTFGSVSSAIAHTIATPRPGFYLEHHPTTRFHIIVPNHLCVPRHEIADPGEIERMRSELHIAVKHLPILIASGDQPDPVAVWLGFRPGMIIKITRPCETAGLEVTYRRCV